jgi:hypothetical protein
MALQSCAHRVLVKSEPAGASVRLLGENGKAGASLGTTPLDLKNLPGNDVALVELEKDGHLPKVIVIPKVQNATITASVRLQPLTREYLAEKNRRDFAASMNSNFAQMLKLQSLVLERNKAEVEKLEGQMKTEFTDVSLFHSLMGNHHFLQANFKEAKIRYEKALVLDPNNEEARTMLTQMR